LQKFLAQNNSIHIIARETISEMDIPLIQNLAEVVFLFFAKQNNISKPMIKKEAKITSEEIG
jgi:hypothetical protein